MPPQSSGNGEFLAAAECALEVSTIGPIAFASSKRSIETLLQSRFLPKKCTKSWNLLSKRVCRLFEEFYTNQTLQVSYFLLKVAPQLTLAEEET